MKKYALVTGAGSGIGRDVSLALLKAGYHVALTGRNKTSLNETSDLAGDYKSNTIVVPSDISNSVSVIELFKIVRSAFGRLDLLFNNAGTNTKGLLEDSTREIGVDHGSPGFVGDVF